MPTMITVNATGKNITVNPTRLFVPGGPSPVTLTWNAAGQTEIGGLQFPQDAPISKLTKVSATKWTADWQPADTSDGGGIWKYSIDVAVNGVPLPTLDPEIENGIPGTGAGPGR